MKIKQKKLTLSTQQSKESSEKMKWECEKKRRERDSLENLDLLKVWSMPDFIL